MLAGPLVPVAQAQGLGEQRPLSGQPPGLTGPLPSGGLLGMATGLPSAQPPAEQAADQGDGAADQGQQYGEADEGSQHQRTPPRVHRGRRRRAISSPSQQRSTSSPSPSPAWSGQRQRLCQPDAQAGQSGLSAHISQPPPPPRRRPAGRSGRLGR